MKKVLFFIICFVSIISLANAESCVVISGDITKVGTEVACGDEHFYIISNDGQEVKMLAKYNLYVGDTVFKVELDQSYETSSEAWNYLYDNYEYALDLIEDENGKYVAGIVAEPLEYDEVKQSPLAIGAHGGSKGEPEFPEIGDIIIEGYQFDDYDGEPYGGGQYLNFIPDLDLPFGSEVREYKRYLRKNKFNVNSVSLITVNELSNTIKSITGNGIPLEDWFDNSGFSDPEYDNNYYTLGSIKELVSPEYEWLYSTTYWTRTLVGNDEYVAFVDTLGDLCIQYDCPSLIGAGLRPVVAIDVEEIEYSITVKTDGNGTIDTDKSSPSGNKVSFEVSSKPGYQLNNLKIYDENGNEIKYDKDNFIMPSANVTIEATFEVENPNTNSFLFVGVLVMSLLSAIILVFSKKKGFNI